jgi:hypothetical protein
MFHHLSPGIHRALEGDDATDFSCWCNEPSLLLQCLVQWDSIAGSLGIPAVGVAHYTVAALALAVAVRSADFLVTDQTEASQQVFDLSAVLTRCAEIVDGVEELDGVSEAYDAVTAIWESDGTLSDFGRVTEWAIDRAAEMSVNEWTAQLKDALALVRAEALHEEPTTPHTHGLSRGPVASRADEVEERLGRLNDLLSRGLITSTEHANKRQQIIDSI